MYYLNCPLGLVLKTKSLTFCQLLLILICIMFKKTDNGEVIFYFESVGLVLYNIYYSVNQRNRYKRILIYTGTCCILFKMLL